MPKVKMGPQTWIFPMPVLLIGALVEKKPNFMTAAWAGIACGSPPMLSIAIRPSRHTLRGIVEQGVFSVNIPRSGQCEDADFCGVYSGKKTDKSELFTVFYGNDPRVPLIEECPVGLECRKVQLLELGSHTLVIGEILESHIDGDCLEEGKPIIEAIDPLAFDTGGRSYYRLGKKAGEAFQA